MKRAVRFASAMLAVGAFSLTPSRACAQDSAQQLQQEIDQLRREFEQVRQQYGDRLTALEQKLASMPGAPPAGAPPTPGQPPPGQPAAPAPQTAQAPQPTAQVPPGAEGAGGPAGALPVYGGAVSGSKVFNPDIAVIGDFLGAAGSNPLQPDPFALGADHPNALQLHESEASFQAVVDPYARADFFISFGEEGVDVEEGYLTLTSLPGGLLTRVGKMRAAFGKVNSLHNHVLPWADRPLVTYNLVGGEDGIDDAGISVARLIPNPWLFLEATGQVFRGDSGAEGSPLFQTTHRSDLSYVGHLRAYHDLTENANLDFGASYSRGHNGLFASPDADHSLVTQLYGIDATYRWRPLQRSIYHSFVGRLEWIRSRRDQPLALGGLQTSDGMYVSGDYQFGRRWFAGARYDRSDRAAQASLLDTGGSFVLTYWPSEFSQVRGQYRRTNYAEGVSANELLFQFQFSIGAHGAHPF
jgi:hypothetical protein